MAGTAFSTLRGFPHRVLHDDDWALRLGRPRALGHGPWGPYCALLEAVSRIQGAAGCHVAVADGVLWKGRLYLGVKFAKAEYIWEQRLPCAAVLEAFV